MITSNTAYLRNLIREYRHLPQCCYFCRARFPLTVHHITPRRFGGTDDVDNLSLLCRPCHEKLHQRPRKSYKAYFWKQLDPVIRKLMKSDLKEVGVFAFTAA